MNAPTVIDATAEASVPRHPLPALVAGSRPRAIVPSDMDQVWRFATIVSKSGLAPKDMQKPEMIAVAIMHGLEVGLTPLMALQRIAVINGRPSIWGDGAMGLVRASGLCEFVSETIVGDDDKMVAICRVKRKGEKDAIERTFSVADAKKAGLYGKAGTWQQYPKRMLQMRARAFALRDLFADVLGGLYIAEELEGEDDERPPKDVTPRKEIRPAQNAALPPQLPHASETEATQPAEAEAPKAGARPLPPRTNIKATPEPVAAETPDDLLKFIETRLAAVTEASALETVWNDEIVPRLEGAFPPDRDTAMALYSQNEKRLGID